MTINVSPQVRIIALAGLLAAVAMLGGMFFLMRPPAVEDEPAAAIKPLYGGKKVSASAGTSGLASAVTAKPTAAAKAKAKAKAKITAAATKTPAEPKPAVKPPALKAPARVTPARAAVATVAPQAVPNPEKLPLSIARQLVDYDVVVVALYNPEAHVDAMALGEARAGAELARARDPRVGFVALDVLASGAPLMKKLGVLPNPALFVYRDAGELAVRIDGFVDRETVAQAALDVVRQ